MNFIDFLKFINYGKVYFSSGYRNSSLLQYFDNNKVEHGFQDQSLAFQALGSAKASKKPIIICTTSGSALAQTLPAFVEAYYKFTPLILISADRPKRLTNSAAPQMIDQFGILKKYTRFSYSQDLANFNIQKTDLNFPMHINIEIEEKNFTSTIQNSQLAPHGKTLIILNKFDSFSHIDHLKKLIQEKNIPSYQEIQSPIYSHTFNNELLYDNELTHRKNEFDSIIRIGEVPNAKIWRLVDSLKADLFHLCPFNYKGCEKGEIINDYDHFFKELNKLPNQKSLTKIDPKVVQEIINQFPESELAKLQKLFQTFSKNSVIYCSNSMPLRYLKFFKFQQEVITNRGANGIDGILSSAIGYAKSTEQVVNLIIGDLSLLYEPLNIFLKELPQNLNIHLINNFGGQIFKQVGLENEILNTHQTIISHKFPFINEIICDNQHTELFWKKFNEFFV